MSKTITVKGIGKATTKPDYVVLTMTLESIHKDYQKAMEIASDKIGQINDALALIGFEKDALKTTNFSVRADYDRVKDKNGDYRSVYAAEIRRCSERMQQLEAKQEELQTAATRYSEVKAWLDTFERAMTSGEAENTSDAALMKALVEQITVSDDGIEVAFKCGAKVTQKYVK